MTEKIKVLNDREQARQKLSIWYGSRDNFYHGIKEMIANAADELKNNLNESPTIIVELSEDCYEVSVQDNGRGIKIGQYTDGVPNRKLLFETLFAGTKYDVTDAVQTGTNGVGTTVLNYTSKKFNVESYYDGMKYEVQYVDGGSLLNENESKNDEKITGTKFTVILDDEMYTHTKFDPKIIEEIVKHFSVAALNIKFIFKHEDYEKVYECSSYEEYFDENVGSTTTSLVYGIGDVKFETDEVVNGQKVIEKNTFNIIVSTNPEPLQETYLNMTYLEEGGSIIDGILDGIRIWANKYCRDNKMFPNKVKNFSKEDVNTSVSVLGIVESNIVEFANQTKLSTNKKTYNDQAKKYVDNLMESMKLNKPKEFKRFINHMLEVQKFNGANSKAREKLKKKLTEKVEGIGNKVEKLIDCEVHGLEAELFVTEGDSANGSIVDSRDDDFQAAFPLRGKVINVLKASIDKSFKNEEVLNLVKIIGTGIYEAKKNDFDINNLRFGKIIITTDADADGDHIASLLITFFYRFMRPLLEQGHIYVAQTPLYELKFSDDSFVYFLSEDEKNKNISKYDGQKYVINRLKGLGEVDAEIMYRTTMNPETRNILQVTVEDAEKMHEMINDWMGDNVEPRKRLIESQISRFVESID